MIAFILAVCLGLASAEFPCGISGVPDTHIVGGTEAPRGRYPWQVSIEICSFFGCFHTCGGVLIGKSTILTAAHCVTGDLDKYEFIVGQQVVEEVGESDKRRLRPRSIKSHELFEQDGRKGFPNDIALVFLASEAPIDGKTVSTACLPKTATEDYMNKECWISGWGKTGGTRPPADKLQHAEIDVLTKDECRTLMQAPIGDYHICVHDRATKARGACMGDSGGPLQCRAKGGNVWDVAGVTSWGRSTCDTKFASVYTRVSYFLDWIKKNGGA